MSELSVKENIANKLELAQHYKSLTLTLQCDELSSLLEYVAKLESRRVRVEFPEPVAWMRADGRSSLGPIFTKNKDYAISQWDSSIPLFSAPVGFVHVCCTDHRNLMHINERGRATSLIWAPGNSESGNINLYAIECEVV